MLAMVRIFNEVKERESGRETRQMKHVGLYLMVAQNSLRSFHGASHSKHGRMLRQ